MILIGFNVMAQADDSNPSALKVSAQLASKNAYVGEGIDLYVNVTASRDRPTLSVPYLLGLEMHRIGEEPPRPIRGNVGDETNLFRTHFLIVPRRPGVQKIPPITARIGERTATSAGLVLKVKGLPEVGRTSNFLGGVGSFEVNATAEPRELRSGQVIDYRIQIQGKAAWGSREAPGLDRLSRLPLAIEVERQPDQIINKPPSRTFKYRLRPTRAGLATLPAVVISEFDPVAGRYVTKVAQGIAIRVTDVPVFDPRTIDDPQSSPQPSAWREWLGGIVVASCVVFGAVRWMRKRWKRPESVARRLCRRVRSDLDQIEGDAGVAELIARAMTEYLAVTIGRSPGALTPGEVREGILEATGSEVLGERAGVLLRKSDRVRFGGEEEVGAYLRTEGARFFRELAASQIQTSTRPWKTR